MNHIIDCELESGRNYEMTLFKYIFFWSNDLIKNILTIQ